MGLNSLLTATGQISASAAVLLPLALLIDRPWTLAFPGAATWGAVIGIALLSTAPAH